MDFFQLNCFYSEMHNVNDRLLLDIGILVSQTSNEARCMFTLDEKCSMFSFADKRCSEKVKYLRIVPSM